MRVIVLGYGGWLSSPWLEYSSIIVEPGLDKFLLDAGEGIYKILRRCTRYDIENLSGILITHSHGDHVLGLPTILLWSLYKGVKIRVLSLESTIEDVKQLIKYLHMEKTLNAVDFIPLNIGKEPIKVFETSSAEIWTVLVKHVVDTIAVKIIEKDSGKSIVYSGDTTPCEEIIKLAKNTDLLIHETCGNVEFKEQSHAHGHSTIGDAIEIALKSGARMLMPIHYFTQELTIPEKSNIKIIIPNPCSTFQI